MITAGDVVVGGTGALPVRLVQHAVTTVLAGERQNNVAISVAFLCAEPMRRLNREHKGHDRPTDVLAFALPQPDGSLAGDIYLCRSVAAHEARGRGVGVREELLRLVVHGTLHVLGHEHPEDGARERSAMWQRQERYLRALT